MLYEGQSGVKQKRDTEERRDMVDTKGGKMMRKSVGGIMSYLSGNVPNDASYPM